MVKNLKCFNEYNLKFMLQHHGNNETKVLYGWIPFLTPTLLFYPGLGLAGEYQKVNPQAESKISKT